MGRFGSTRFIPGNAIAVMWLLVLAIAGRPIWLAALLGLVIVLVALAPMLLAGRRLADHRLGAPARVDMPPARADVPAAEAQELRPRR